MNFLHKIPKTIRIFHSSSPASLHRSSPLLCWISKIQNQKKGFIVMGIPESTSPLLSPPSPVQLKLYQAFIFSVPVLFTIILFLLFYLFYFKRSTATTTTTSNPSPSPPIQPWISHQDTTLISVPFEVGLKKEVRDSLPVIVYDESFKAQDLQCCVCLGEFQKNEHLNQILACKHVFHIDCIHHWFMTNTTCPLCRTSILPIGSLNSSDPPAGSIISRQGDANTGNPHLGSSHPGPDVVGTNLTSFASEV